MASPPSDDLDDRKDVGEVADILQEWKDVSFTALPVNEIVYIDYSDDFRTIFGLLREVRRIGEKSERSLRLAKKAISLNPADFTAWSFRKDVANALAARGGNDIWRKELAFMTTVIINSPKNYQAWDYRRHVATALQQFDAEIGFIDLILNNDAKNYHAWSHRQWLVQQHGVTDGELDATTWFIDSDMRNNSAWNHRWLLVKGLSTPLLEEQMAWALVVVDRAPRNESAWNFVHVLAKLGVNAHNAKRVALDYAKSDERNVPAQRFFILNAARNEASVVEELCQSLLKADPIRRKYWELQLKSASQARSRPPDASSAASG